MKKSIMNLALLSCLGALLTGCGATETPAAGEGRTGGEEPIVNRQYSEPIMNPEIPLTATALAKNNLLNSAFVTDLTYELNQGNVMFSPLSLNFALGMVLEGTSETSPSRAVLEQYLAAQNYSDFVRSYMDYADTVNQMEPPKDSSMEIHYDIANAVWANESFPLIAGYQKTVEDLYKAEVQNLNFGDPQMVSDTVNDWVNNKTRGMIPQIIAPSMISDKSRVVLTNAVYFESPWAKEWEPVEYEKKFTNRDGSVSTPKFIVSEACSGFLENDKAIAFAKRYSGGLEFIGILPREEGEFSLADLDIEALLDNREKCGVTAFMPELDFETNIALNPILEALGMEILFSDDADIKLMCEDEVKISTILQKTKLELDAKGTKAAAATAVVMNKCEAVSAPPRREIVDLNRPFAFMIYDTENEVPVFMGKVTDLQ